MKFEKGDIVELTLAYDITNGRVLDVLNLNEEYEVLDLDSEGDPIIKDVNGNCEGVSSRLLKLVKKADMKEDYIMYKGRKVPLNDEILKLIQKEEEVTRVPDSIDIRKLSVGLHLCLDYKRHLSYNTYAGNFCINQHINYRKIPLKLVKINRYDLKAGDIAYRQDDYDNDYEFTNDSDSYVLIINETETVYMYDGDILTDHSGFDQWYKVVEIE